MKYAPEKSFYGWKLLAALWCIVFVNLAFPTYGTTVVNAYMATDLHMDRKTLGSVFSLYMIMTASFAFCSDHSCAFIYSP